MLPIACNFVFMPVTILERIVRETQFFELAISLTNSI